MVTLQDEGLIQTGSAVFMSAAWGKDGSAFIEYSLTEMGENNKDKILFLTYEKHCLFSTLFLTPTCVAFLTRMVLRLQRISIISPMFLNLALLEG